MNEGNVPVSSLLELPWSTIHPVKRTWVGNAIGSSRSVLAGSIARESAGLVLVVVAGQTVMEDVVDELEYLGATPADRFWEGEIKADAVLPPVFPFPHLETLPYEYKPPESHLKSDRLRVYEILSDLSEEKRLLKDRKAILVAPIAALMAGIPDLKCYHQSRRVLRPGLQLDRDEFTRFLFDEGYEQEELLSGRGCYSVRGGIIDLFPFTANEPIRIELFGDEIDSIRTFDLSSQRSRAVVDSLVLGSADELMQIVNTWNRTGKLNYFWDFLPADTVVVWDLPNQLYEEAERYTALVQKMYQHRELQEAEGETPEDNPLLKIPPDQLYRSYEVLEQGMDLFNWVSTSDIEVEEEPGYQSIHLPLSSPNLIGLDFKMKIRAMVQRYREGETFLVVCDNEGQKQRLQELVMDFIDSEEALMDPTEMRRSALQVERAMNYTLETQATRKKKISQYNVPGIRLDVGTLRQGFHCNQTGLTVVNDQEIFGRFRKIRTRKIHTVGVPILDLVDLHPGDFVVHIDHGIGRFVGLKRLTIAGREGEYLELRYQDEDVLYVPIEQIDRVSRYVGSESNPPVLSKLGSKVWASAKARAKKAIEDMTQELLALYAAREARQGFAYSADTPWQHEFEASFPYTETPDQWKAIREVKEDMESTRCMDRLICGDVGFGKTEVALRAAFKAVCEGKQVAILAPTTVLVQQHYQTFRDRMMDFPVTVESVSRFRGVSEVKKVLEKVRLGDIDILIGTHRLLSKDVQFKDLGLVVIDEEQRFGVKHKERFKHLRTQVDVITLTATPIPRTLYMAMTGIRDMSLVNTPPSNRLPIETHIIEFKPENIESAILRELARGGQVFFLHNRVESIYGMADMVQRIVPEAKIAVGHGQMESHELEKIMLRFIAGEVDVLICTTIIESGLDIANANTILINRADTFGISEMYQLRGRVGRDKHQAYCYLMVPSKKDLTLIARERLRTLVENTALGSGFQIAMKDLEIRGMGNILGGQQHGHIAAIGFDLYASMLSKAVKTLRGMPVEEDLAITFDSYRSGHFPQDYIPSGRQRMSIHKRLAAARSKDQIRRIKEEIIDLYGRLPPEAERVFFNMELKEQARKAGVDMVKVRSNGAVLRFMEEASARFSPAWVVELEKAYPRKIRLSVSNNSKRIQIEVLPPTDENLWEDTLVSILKRMEGLVTVG